MIDNNAKAPKVRSGDVKNPIVALIVRISIYLLFAAATVIITLILVEHFSKKQDDKDVLYEKTTLTIDQFKAIEKGEWQDDLILADEKVKNILKDKKEEDVFYFYFYYRSLKGNINKETINIIDEIKEDATIFFVDLEKDQNQGENEAPKDKFKDELLKFKKLNENNNDINATLNRMKKNGKDNIVQYQTFIIKFVLKDKIDNKNPFEIIRDDEQIVNILKGFEKKPKE